MAKQQRKKCTSLEVHVMFEPTRLEHACLQKSYAWVVPCTHKRLSPQHIRQQVSDETLTQSPERNAQ